MHTSELTASAKALGPVPVGGHVAASSSHASPLRNRAAEAVSPFVKSYDDSPVAWQALDNATVELAKKEHKLVFLHIGYKACHRKEPERCLITSTDLCRLPPHGARVLLEP